MIESPKNFIEQFQNFIEHIAGVMKTFLTKEVADNYYLGKSEKASSASLADTATKATQDANGNVIPKTYATKSELTSGLATKQPVGDYPTVSELDSRYLGIDAKAKSAETADSVESIDISKVTGFNIPRVYGSRVDINLRLNSNQTKTWTSPASGLLAIHGNEYSGKQCTINGTELISVGSIDRETSSISDSNSGYFPMQKDDVIKIIADYRGNSFKASFYPLQLIKGN